MVNVQIEQILFVIDVDQQKKIVLNQTAEICGVAFLKTFIIRAWLPCPHKETLSAVS